MARYVFNDLHAQINLWEQIKNYIKKDNCNLCYINGELIKM